jgi:hypothetical protein
MHKALRKDKILANTITKEMYPYILHVLSISIKDRNYKDMLVAMVDMLKYKGLIKLAKKYFKKFAF